METIACRHPNYRDHNTATVLATHKHDLHDIALELLKTVGITAPEKRMSSYAHQLSGGMRQRIMIALALVGSPKLLLADEPTTALDVVVQRELLQELRETIRKLNMSMLLVTHDLHLAHDIADKVSVMYAGYLLEEGPVTKVLPNPSHPYVSRAHLNRSPAKFLRLTNSGKAVLLPVAAAEYVKLVTKHSTLYLKSIAQVIGVLVAH